MDLGITGKTAVVVGAGRGIGRATAETLAANGAQVALVSRTAAELDTLRDAILERGGRATPFAADVSQEDSLRNVLEAIKNSMGPPQLFVWSVTALFRYHKLHNASFEDVTNQVHREVSLPMLAASMLLPDMMRDRFGRLVFVGSLAARIASKGAPVYCVAKASLESLCRSIAVDYSRYGITANVARLGFTDTQRLRTRIADEPDRAQRYAQAMSTQRLILPEEAAHSIAFLCSQLAGSITGSVLDVTGGLELANHW